MELVTYSGGDMWLTEAIETDPVMMANLGGPVPREDIPRIHARRLEHVAKGAWYFTIVPEPSGPPVGTIGIWASDCNGAEISEITWAVLGEFQGRGLASEALRLILGRAREDGRWGPIHAFTAIANGPSNALCRKFGFVLVEECDIDYAGRPLRCNHWVLEDGPGRAS